MKGKRRMKWSAAIAMGAMLSSQLAAPLAFADKGEGGDGETQTPIKHVIVLIGENHSFDNIYATYQPKSGQTVLNLLGEGIVKPDGSPDQTPAWLSNLRSTPRCRRLILSAPVTRPPILHFCLHRN